MKLVFKKDEDQNIQVFIKEGEHEEEFSYIKMVQELVEKNEFDETEFDESITEDEKNSINEMLREINSSIIEEAKESGSSLKQYRAG